MCIRDQVWEAWRFRFGKDGDGHATYSGRALKAEGNPPASPGTGAYGSSRELASELTMDSLVCFRGFRSGQCEHRPGGLGSNASLSWGVTVSWLTVGSFGCHR